MNMQTQEELEAEMDRQRQEASERTKHSNSYSRTAAFLILPLLGFWAATCFVVLYAFSEWRKMVTIIAIVGVLVVVEFIALKINRKKGSPYSPYSIFIVLLLAIAAVLALLVEV